MSGGTWLQFLVLIALVAGVTPLLGGYMAKVYAPETAGAPPGDRRPAPCRRRHRLISTRKFSTAGFGGF